MEDFDDYEENHNYHDNYDEDNEDYYNNDYQYDSSIDNGCGEGYSCSECTNAGCSAHPLN
ncbi:hypothetical protein [Acetobacteroides hydrogenigenes]|uniref:hypothetical protein n=1 Tax=Acetobacteroides hydrogenigenes TaxID=979970 RepID=UPI00105124C9|nr:hypothetical protein [Acetobacteroides hydrogenigenes]